MLDEYREHWPLTARQLFYRLVGAHGFDKSEAFYSTLCHHVANARRARLIPFAAIRDDGVMTLTMDHYADADAFRAVMRERAENYRRDLMADQDVHTEIWCEAAGMVQQLARIGHQYSIRAYSSSGFDSLTAKKALADRICATGKPAFILHLGDLDPSGKSMFDVAAEDVQAFVQADRANGLVKVEFVRVALTWAQVTAYHLPTSPAKTTDSRSKGWTGETCQLEALAPDQIAALLKVEIEKIVDIARMNAALAAEEDERQQLTRLLPTPVSTASRNNGETR
ncbi:hypothetical protein CDQ91_14390 [Sphingopyxis witflariensis]|uniref:Uncharacterized protein n=1 Tax=Sphingopyxis witflariensis TaxID=173675 RepID=A0A2D0ANU6_9SPHN|nr:hypothetical protein CDQ91_14390 [Sphingopyxis witflariensis]